MSNMRLEDSGSSRVPGRYLFSSCVCQHLSYRGSHFIGGWLATVMAVVIITVPCGTLFGALISPEHARTSSIGRLVVVQRIQFAHVSLLEAP